MRNPYFSNLPRLRVRSDDPNAITAPRPNGTRRPHTDARVAQVRSLVEQSTLTYAQIEARTGVGRASICRWTRDGSWERPAFAPRATDTVPRARASAQLRRRTLAARLDALADRHLRELEESASVDPARLAEALELMKMAKVAARPKRRWFGDKTKRPPRMTDAPGRVLARLAAHGVDLDRAPLAALADFILSHGGPEYEHPALRARGRRR